MLKNILMYVGLPLAIIAIGYFLISGIMEPERFNQEKNRREALVVERLIDIRTLQVAYKGEYSKYTASFDTLINFYKNGVMRVVKQIGSMDDSLAVAKGLVRRDTIRIAIKDTLLRKSGFNIDSIGFVPVVHKPFEMKAVIRKVSGVDMPLFEACTPFDIILAGLDRQLVVNLNDERKKTDRYPGWKVGNVEQANNNAGNWE